MKHIAAIDIGSNASRLLIKETESMSGRYVPQVRNELDYFVRTPLRLGLDVYTERVISPEKERQLAETLLQYRQIMDRYHTAGLRHGQFARRAQRRGSCPACQPSERRLRGDYLRPGGSRPLSHELLCAIP